MSSLEELNALTDGVLARNVNEVHPVTGDPVSFEAGSSAPVWLAQLATNPAIWEGGVAPHAAEAAGGNGDGPPPQGGTGSGKEAWAAYARSRGVPVGEDVTRDQIIAACSASGVPVE